MIMDPLMMCPSLIWILAERLGRLHEYSEDPREGEVEAQGYF